jgi:DNA sulfur modification protein DndE
MKGDDFNRVQISKGATSRLHSLQGDIGITPNYICRAGLCYSLNEPRPPSPGEYDTDGQVLNRYTLLGDHDPLYMALVKERMIQDGKDPDEGFYEEFLAHLNRGVIRLAGNVDDLSDFYRLIPAEVKDE